MGGGVMFGFFKSLGSEGGMIKDKRARMRKGDIQQHPNHQNWFRGYQIILKVDWCKFT